MIPPADMLQRIARVSKSNGTGGEVVISFLNISPEDIDIEEPVFIAFDGLPVPFFFESFTRKGTNKAIAKLTGIDSIEDADEIAGSFILADSRYMDAGSDEQDFSFLEGWAFASKDGKTGGTIRSFLDIPGNPCLEVQSGSGGFMIPLHEDLIVSVDSESRRIVMDIPEGLL